VRISHCWWLIAVLLATKEAEMKSIVVQSQPRQIVWENLSQKCPTHEDAGKKEPFYTVGGNVD
jgi:hypothetical protein